MDIERRLEIAGELIVRSKILLDGWLLSAGAEGRAAHCTFWDEFWHYWRFNEHALLVTFVIHMASLFETRPDTVNLYKLWDHLRVQSGTEQMQEEVSRLFLEAAPIAKGLTILRSNVMAHRSARIEYSDAFKYASLTPDAMRRLTELSLAIVNLMRIHFGKHLLEFDEHALNDLRAIASYPERPDAV